MSSPIWYPKSQQCWTCKIACTIEASSKTKYDYGKETLKPTIRVCPYGQHTDTVVWVQ